MSKELDELRQRMDRFHDTGTDTVFQGVVTGVDEKEFSCTVRRDNAVDYFDVRLRVLITSEGFALIPRRGSTVLVCRIGNSNELFVCQFSEIDKIICTDRQTRMQVTDQGFTFERGNSGLKKTLTDLLSALEKLTVPTAVGPSGIPVNVAEFARIKKDLSNYLEE